MKKMPPQLRLYCVKRVLVMVFAMLAVVSSIATAIVAMRSTHFATIARVWEAKFNYFPADDESAKRVGYIICGIFFLVYVVCNVCGFLGAFFESVLLVAIYVVQSTVLIVVSTFQTLADPTVLNIGSLLFSAFITGLVIFFLRDLYIIRRSRSGELKLKKEDSSEQEPGGEEEANQ